jgi:hypothetical protein
LPTPIQDAEPCQGERPYGGLLRCPLLALLLVIDLCPAGRPDRCGGPLHARVAQELGTLETPGHPGVLPAAFRHGRDAGLCLQGSGGRLPFPLRSAGAQAAGRQDGARAGQGLQQGASGLPLGVLGHGWINRLDRVQGHAQLTDEGLDEQGMGGMTPSSVVKGVAGLLACTRLASPSPTRTWGA